MPVGIDSMDHDQGYFRYVCVPKVEREHANYDMQLVVEEMGVLLRE